MSYTLSTVSVKFTENELREILKKTAGCDDVHIRSIECGDGSEKKGDSYLSTIYRFTVEASGKNKDKEENITLHLIAKGFPKNIARRKTFRSPDFFGTEIYFYSKVWPLMKNLKSLKKINEQDEVPLYISSFCDGQHDYIALKDISFDGYSTVQRNLGINKEFASLFLKLLAHFHALSIAARHHNPEFETIARSLKETYYNERLRSWYTNFMQYKLLEVIRKAVRTQLELIYLDKINKLFSGDFFGLLCQLAKGPPSKLLAVTQGDAWMPNFLVRTENDKPVEAVLIDFQLARYASVTGDLLQFLYSCISQDVLLDHWDSLVEEYHQYLSKRLELLGCGKDFITLEDIKEDIEKNCHIGFAMALESTVMSQLEDHEVPDLDTLQGKEAVPLETIWDISPFEDVARNQRVAFVVKHAVDKGFI